MKKEERVARGNTGFAISPASIHGCRVALSPLGTSSDTFVASRSSVYQLKFSTSSDADLTPSSPYDGMTALSVEATPLSLCFPHRAEIQDLQTSSTLSDGDSFFLGASDSTGRTTVSLLRLHGGEDRFGAAGGFALASLPSAGEWGWSGVALAPLSSSSLLTATANHFGKCVQFFENDSCVRRVYTLHRPTQLCFLPPPSSASSSSSDASAAASNTSPLLLVTERNHLSLWDVRMAEKNGCANRFVMGTNDELLALSCGNNVIAVAGEGRTVSTFDLRIAAPLARWAAATKYATTALLFLHSGRKENVVGAMDDLCLAAGLDSELVCADWASSSNLRRGTKAKAFHGDSRWIGIQKQQEGGKERVVGVTEQGSVYIIHNAAEELLLSNENDKKNKQEDKANKGKRKLSAAESPEQRQRQRQQRRDKTEKQQNHKKRMINKQAKQQGEEEVQK